MSKTEMTLNNRTETVLKILKAFQNIDSEFPLQYAICLLEISRREGMSLTDLSVKTGLSLSTLSRIAGALSDKRQKGAPYGLIKAVIPPEEKRKRTFYLTGKGHKAVQNITAALA